jgi:hypothetical protein
MKPGPFRRNPPGRWGLRAISSSLVVVMNEHQLLLAPRPRLASPTGDSYAISDSGHYRFETVISEIQYPGCPV